ncbi:hypothetical protein SynA1562_01645 [Synechococcus sp. A15-62]|nr:hypothetical protein SynA1562_01645 [Synechococcus sp. A15-62]
MILTLLSDRQAKSHFQQQQQKRGFTRKGQQSQRNRPNSTSKSN